MLRSQVLTLVSALVSQTWAFNTPFPPAFTPNPNPPVQGQAVNQLSALFAVPAEINDAANTITLRFSDNVLNAAAGVLTSGTDYDLKLDALGAGTPVTDAVVTVTGATMLTLSTNAANPIPANENVELVIKGSTALAVGTTAGVQVTFDLADTGSNDNAVGIAGWTPTAPVVLAASDPVTWFGDKKTKFWLPAEKYTPLLETPDVSISAKPLLGPKDMQWFDRLRITLPGGGLLAEVFTARGEEVNGKKVIGHQIKVDVGEDIQVGLQPEAMQVGLSTRDGKVKAALYTVPYHIARTHGNNEIEHLYIETPSIAFSVYASHAGNEFPDDVALQTKYKHLDFMIRNTALPWSKYTGVLLELWEVIPRSAAVEAMMISPEAEAKVCDV